MGCGSCSQRYRGAHTTSQRTLVRRRRGQKRPIRGAKKVEDKKQVIDSPLINKSDTVTPSPTGPTIPSNGMSVAVQQTGINPDNLIGQRLPETVNPVVVDANKGESTSPNPAESQVIPTPGGN